MATGISKEYFQNEVMAVAVNDHIFNRETNLQDKVAEGEYFLFEDISFNDLEITLMHCDESYRVLLWLG